MVKIFVPRLRLAQSLLRKLGILPVLADKKRASLRDLAMITWERGL